MALSRQVLFDTGAARSVCSTTRNPTASSGRHESCSLRFQVPQHVCWTQKIEGSFDVRNVTKPIVAAGQGTDRGQGVWLNGDRRVHPACEVGKKD